MKRFKFLLLALLIAELACVGLFVYDAYTCREQGEWQLFPVMNMRKYPRERIGMYPYPNLSAASAYAETLPSDSRFLQLTEIENRVLSASFFCIPLYSLLLALLKRKPEKGSLLLCLLNTVIAITVAVFIHSYLRDTYGAFYANEYFPFAYLSWDVLAPCFLIWLSLLPLVYVFGKSRETDEAANDEDGDVIIEEENAADYFDENDYIGEEDDNDTE